MMLEETIEDPIDCVEWIAVEADWDFRRPSRDEATLTIPGDYATYEVSFTWAADHSVLMMSCDFGIILPAERKGILQETFCHVNSHLTLGHFDRWPGEDKIRHRQSLVAGDSMFLNSDQLEAMIRASLIACDRYYTTFQLAASSRLSMQEVLNSTLLRASGSA